MPKYSKYSSFKKQQILTENFRRFLDEDSGEEEGRHYKDDEEEDEKHLRDLEKDVRFDKDRVHEGEGLSDLASAAADAAAPGPLPQDAKRDDDDENLDEQFTVTGLYRTSKAEMEDMLRDMYNELHDQGGGTPSDIDNAVDAMERNVDNMKYSSAKHSGAQAAKYNSSQQYMTGREAYRAMMWDFGYMLLSGGNDDVEGAIKRIMSDAVNGKYSLRNYRENKNRKRKGKKTSLLEIKRRRSRARRKQNK